MEVIVPILKKDSCVCNFYFSFCLVIGSICVLYWFHTLLFHTHDTWLPWLKYYFLFQRKEWRENWLFLSQFDPGHQLHLLLLLILIRLRNTIQVTLGPSFVRQRCYAGGWVYRIHGLVIHLSLHCMASICIPFLIYTVVVSIIFFGPSCLWGSVRLYYLLLVNFGLMGVRLRYARLALSSLALSSYLTFVLYYIYILFEVSKPMMPIMYIIDTHTRVLHIFFLM